MGLSALFSNAKTCRLQLYSDCCVLVCTQEAFVLTRRLIIVAVNFSPALFDNQSQRFTYLVSVMPLPFEWGLMFRFAASYRPSAICFSSPFTFQCSRSQSKSIMQPNCFLL
jgi:hypothetical protein